MCVSSGFSNLDCLTSGWRKSELTIIGYRQDFVKNAFLCSVIRRIAVTNKIGVGLLNLEMGNEQLINRLIENVSHVPKKKIHEGCLTQDDWRCIATAVRELKETPLYSDDDVISDIFSITGFGDKASMLVKEKDVQILFVDRLHYNSSDRSFFSSSSSSEEENFHLVTEELRSLAKKLDIPIVAFVDVNPFAENGSTENVWKKLSPTNANYVCLMSSASIPEKPQSCSVSFEVQSVMTGLNLGSVSLNLDKDTGIMAGSIF